MTTPEISTSIRKTGRRIVNRILRPFGVQIYREVLVERSRRATYAGGLAMLKKAGFDPKTVIDVGVASGTMELYEAFPTARHVLIDPLEEARPFLEEIKRKFAHVEYILAAAGDAPGTLELNVHPDIARSSAYWESDYDPAVVEKRRVPAVTIDQIRREKNLEGPILLKVDVQGGELKVLEGAAETLNDVECIVLETSLYEFFKGGPLVSGVVDYMQRIGFAVQDVWSLQYRNDGTLLMIDFAFVRTNGMFRTVHRFRGE